MAYDSQQTNLQAVTDLSGLAHEVFVGDIVSSARWSSVTSQLFKDASEGSDYTLEGSKMTGAAELLRPHGAQATGGQLPDHTYQDLPNWEVTPVRRYVRRAVDNVVEARVTGGRGSFESLADRLVTQMWGSWELMEIHHAVGGSEGTLCLVSARSSSTVWTATAGYGHTGTDPLQLLDEGMIICWHDSSVSNTVAGAGKISSINYSTNAVTMDSASTWEPSAQLAANDIICKATTNDITTDYFKSERNLAPNGTRTILDPDGNNTTVHNISESTYPRWQPYRQTSSTLDHVELTEFMRKFAAKSYAPVGPDSHTAVTNGAVTAELARTLIGFQQQQQLGKTLEGGYQTIRIAGMDFAEDPYQVHDEINFYCTEDLYYVNLVSQGYFDEDGSMYSRLADFDGKEFFARDACQFFSPRRNRHGSYTGITLSNVTATDFTPTPNY